MIFAERQKRQLVVSLSEPPKIAEINEPGTNATESPLRMSTKAKVENRPGLLEEEWEDVSMHVDDLEPEAVVMSIPSKEKRSPFLKMIWAEVGRGRRTCLPSPCDIMDHVRVFCHCCKDHDLFLPFFSLPFIFM